MKFYKPMKTEPKKTLTDTRVDEVLSEKPPTLHPDDNMQQAGDRMREMATDDWPVAKEEELMGVMDAGNPDRTVARYGHDPKSTLVGDNMSHDLVYCYDDQNCAEALAIMDARHFQYLPVVNREHRIVGIVSREELIVRCVAEGETAEKK